MVPARVVAIGELPLSGNGKVSRRQLAREPLLWEEAPEELGMVAAAWREAKALPRAGRCQVLGVPVRASSNFLVLGGDSLAALRVCQRLGRLVRCPAYAVHCDGRCDEGLFGEELPEPLPLSIRVALKYVLEGSRLTS